MSGVPVHGNYYGYYIKRPFFKDERLSALPSELFRGCRVLDVGCNEGWITCEIAQSYGALSVTGVDIDEKLIEGAWRRRRAMWSTQAPTCPKSSAKARNDIDTSSSTEATKRNLQDRDADVVENSPEPHYFPVSCEHEFGSLPIPPSSNRGKDVFPHNITFRNADWVKTAIPEDSQGYDVVVAFSLSKWIHLNGGDEGLKYFFRRIFEVLKPGGTFILEPQPWESYAKAKRLNHTLKENAGNLMIRPADFPVVLEDIGFLPRQHFGTIGEGVTCCINRVQQDNRYIRQALKMTH